MTEMRPKRESRTARRIKNWTRRFLKMLRTGTTVAEAAAKTGVCVTTVYQRRRRCPAFAAAFAAARADGMEELEDKAREMAEQGNSQLLMFLLKAHLPERYGGGAAAQEGPSNPEHVDGRLLAQRVLASPEARALACRLLAVVAGGAEPGGPRASGDERRVDSRPALEPPQ